MNNLFRRVGAVNGAVAVGMGAYQSHGCPVENADMEADARDIEYRNELFSKANTYHFYTSFALLATPLCKYPAVPGTLLTLGTAGFCGALYAKALKKDFPAKAAPAGGMALMAGWLALVL
eukprot:GFYU01024602.1.p1 GENE.GFYU01024602.1~~GFYU01024602.1.p1  ORF type:complete len:120 (-),score=26.25 GFYU01024602.1:19-378(-)